MQESIISIPSINEIPSAGKELLKNFPECRVFAFFGEMGAGKTTIIKEMCRQMGVPEDEMSSPTFALINEYKTSPPQPSRREGEQTRKAESSEEKELLFREEFGRTGIELVYHFDFYRIKNETEAFDMGYEDYFYSGNYCFIEWAEKIPNLLPETCVKVQLVAEGLKRKIMARLS